jgi:hypothetical protein
MSVLFLPPSAGAASVPDATETTAGKIRIATSAEATAGTNDLTSMTPLKVKSVVDAAVVGGVTYQGTFDASSPADLSNASKGDLYIISVAGSYQGQDWAVGDHLLINADMGGTLDPNKIDKVDNTDSVTSVAGRTGAVVLSASDVSGLATVATSGAYSDLSGTPSLATVATTGAYSDLTGTPTLGTAAAEDVGTGAGNVVQLNGSAQLPAVDGSLLTNISASVAALDDIGDVTITTPANGEALIYNSTSGDWENGTVSASVAALDDIGDVTITTPANTQVIKYNSTSGDWENGAVAYADVSGTPTLATVATTGAYSDLSGTPTLATVATTGAYSDLSGLPTLGTAAALDVGTSATNVVQLDGSARLPAVDGSQLTNLPSGASTLGALTDVTITSVANTQVIKYNSTSGDWENGAVAYSEVTGTPSLGTAAALDVGTSANNVVQLDGSARLPAVDGSQLTNLPSGGSAPSVTVSSPSTDQTLSAPSGIEEAYIYTPSAAITVNLVAAATCGSGFKYQIKNRSTNTITIDPNGSETVDGAATFALSIQEASVTLITDGSNWFII